MDNTFLVEAYRTRKLVRYSFYFIAALVVIALLGFFVAPPVAKSVAIAQASKLLHRPVAIDKIRINPFAMTFDVDGLSIKEREGEEIFLGFDSFHVNVDSTSLFKGGAVLSEIRLVNPRARVVRLADDRFNFSDLLEEFAAKPGQGEAKTSKTLFSLNNIQVSGGNFVFDDRPLGEKHEIGDINLTLPFLSNMDYALETFVEPAFSAVVNGAPLHAKGKSRPFKDSQDSELSIDLSEVKVPNYLIYSPVKPPVRLASGQLDTALKVNFHNDQGKNPSLHVSGTATLKNFDVRQPDGSALAAFKKLDIALASSDILARRFVVERLALDSPDVNIHIDRQGKLNLANLAGPGPAQPPGVRQAPPKRGKSAAKSKAQAKPEAKPARAETVAAAGESTPAAKPETSREAAPAGTDGKAAAPAHAVKAAEPGKPVIWSVGELTINGGSVHLLDESRGAPVQSLVDALELSLKKLDSDGVEPSDLKTSFRFNRKGEIALEGQVNPLHPAADLKVAVKTLELLPLQPYFGDKLNIELTRGQLTADGVLQIRRTPAKDAAALEGKFAGQATLGDLQTVDKVNSADFLRWKSLYVGKIDVDLSPLSVAVGEIALSDFFARVIVSKEGKLNLLQIVRQDESAPTPALTEADPAKTPAVPEGKASAPVEPKPGDKPTLPLRIDKITLQGGDVRFTDNFVKPNYTANLKKIGGRITNLSSAPGTVANLELRGTYDNIAPLTVNAKINPLAAKPYLDLQAEVKGVELTSLSTYAAKYAGYAIEKGKLSLTVNYKIENDQLQAQNRVFIDQLTFGENRIDGPDATSLPVKLAVSLLKNRAGEIDLDLPISGTLSDPQFSIGGLVVKVIVNLLSKAITAPFALLGSLFGGEEMSMIEFPAGHATISPDAEKRLENLAKALVDRPGLKLEVTAFVDPESDREGLKRAGIERKVRAVKREQGGGKGDEGDAAARVEVSREEYPGLLEKAYRAEKFPKPRNMIGLTKSLPVEEMEKLMLANATVGDEDLQNLGERRARRVRDWLVDHQVPSERVFLLPTKVAEPGAGQESEKSKKGSGSRVDFSLK